MRYIAIKDFTAVEYAKMSKPVVKVKRHDILQVNDPNPKDGFVKAIYDSSMAIEIGEMTFRTCMEPDS